MLEVASPDYSQLLATYLKARDSFRVADKNYARAQDLYQHSAIAERDLLQAESDRNQAQADLNASEQAMKILGIKNPDDLAKAPSSSAEIPVIAPIGGEVVERLVSPGQVMQAGQTQAFTISDMSTVWVLANVYQNDLAYVKMGDNVVVQTDAYPDSFHGRHFVHFGGARSEYTHAAGAHRGRQPRRKAEEGHVLHGDRGGRRDSECDRRAGCVRAARRRESAVRLRGEQLEPVRTADGRDRREPERADANSAGAFGGRKSGGGRQPVPAIREFVAALQGRSPRRTLH